MPRAFCACLVGLPLLVSACAEADSPEAPAPTLDASAGDAPAGPDGSADAFVAVDGSIDTGSAAFDSGAGGPKDGGGAKDGGASKDGGTGKDATADAEAFGACTKTAGTMKDCKACCDCSTSVACDDHKVCREACNALGEAFFAANPSPTPVVAPSTLGAGGDYATCTSLATEQACKDCCDCSTKYLCGDHGFCRSACSAKFGDAGVSDAATGG